MLGQTCGKRYLVCETHIAWLQSASENLSNLLVSIELASANPNKERSVNNFSVMSGQTCGKRYLVCETHIAWLQSANENLSNLLVSIELASANPNKE